MYVFVYIYIVIWWLKWVTGNRYWMFSSSQPAKGEIITQEIQCYDRQLASSTFKKFLMTGQPVSIHIIMDGNEFRDLLQNTTKTFKIQKKLPTDNTPTFNFPQFGILHVLYTGLNFIVWGIWIWLKFWKFTLLTDKSNISPQLNKPVLWFQRTQPVSPVSANLHKCLTSLLHLNHT